MQHLCPVFGILGIETKSAVIESTLALVNLPSLFTLLKIFRTVFLTVSIKKKIKKIGIYILEPVFWDILLCSANLKKLYRAVEKAQKV